jgi:hypothetical protein
LFRGVNDTVVYAPPAVFLTTLYRLPLASNVELTTKALSNAALLLVTTRKEPKSELFKYTFLNSIGIGSL